MNPLDQIQFDFRTDTAQAFSSGDFDTLYLKYFSKTHGIITELMKTLPAMDQEKKQEMGPILNKLQDTLKAKIEASKQEYLANQTSQESLDLSYKVANTESGMLHPTTQVTRELNDYFRYNGYSIAEGPEIETAEYNFRRLNLPEGHPATDLQDTLFIQEPDILLRTHTSSIEARILASQKPPIRIIAHGKCYRNETPSPTNSSFFHQYQGVVVDKGITIQNLKSTMEGFAKFLFGENINLRFRYKYYPEVSPGLGTDIQCKFCNGRGCDICKQRGWMEVCGSGMIHTNTLKMSGINPEVYTGFAFGMGLDRLAMAKFNIPDIRKLYGGVLVYSK